MNEKRQSTDINSSRTQMLKLFYKVLKQPLEKYFDKQLTNVLERNKKK